MIKITGTALVAAALLITSSVFAGDTVRVTAAEKDGAYEVSAINQEGETLMVGEARLRD